MHGPSDPGGSIAAAVGNPALRRVVVAFGLTAVAEWALWVGLLVAAFEQGGSRAAAYVSVGLLVPAAMVAPLAGAMADRGRPNRLLVAVHAVQGVSLTVAALTAWLQLPLVVVVGTAAIATTLVTAVRPACSVVVPGLVMSPAELTAANVLTGYASCAGVLGGPLLAGGLLVVGGPGLVLAACGLLNLTAAATTAPLARLDPPRGYQLSPTPRRRTSPGVFRADLRTLLNTAGMRPLLAVIGIRYVLIGGIDLLTVVLAQDIFGLGASGPGLLTATVGAGAVVGGVSNTFLAGRDRLAPPILAACGVLTVAGMLMAGWVTLVVALVALLLVGAALEVIDVTTRLLVQRAAPPDSLASIFAAVEVLSLLGCAAGAAMVPVLLAVDLRLALLLVAAFPALVSVTARAIRRIDTAADRPVVAVRLLRRISIFSSLPGTELERVARAARLVTVEAGEVVVRVGDRGDTYFAIAGGSVEVEAAGRPRRVMGRGEGFGEIALLADIPRTATVTARTDSELLEVARVPFLTALTGHDASRRTAWALARAYGFEHGLRTATSPVASPGDRPGPPGPPGRLGPVGQLDV